MPSFSSVQQLRPQNLSWAFRNGNRVPRRQYSSHSHPPRPSITRPNRPPNVQRPSSPTSSENPAAAFPSRYFRPLARFFAWYARQQSLRPYITQLCSTPIIFGVGDLSAQTIGDDEYDLARSLRTIIIGAVISIPSYKWFLLLGRHFNYSSTALSTGAKVAVNQFVYTPLFNVYFFAFHAFLSGEGAVGTVERVKSAVSESIPRSFLYWPLATTINFTYVQPQYRAVVTGLFGVVWQTYLSWLNRRTEKDERRITGDSESATES